MLRRRFILFMLLLVFLVGCGEHKAANLKNARTLAVEYVIREPATKSEIRKQIVIREPEKLRPILEAVNIQSEHPGVQASLTGFNSLTFTFADGTEVKAAFVEPTYIDRFRWGQIILDRKFYDKINEVLSKQEGRPIDVLKINQ